MTAPATPGLLSVDARRDAVHPVHPFWPIGRAAVRRAAETLAVIPGSDDPLPAGAGVAPRRLDRA